MSELDPTLKRLMKWSRQATREEAASEVPFGFATKAASLGVEEAAQERSFNGIATLCGTLASVVIVASGLFLWDQALRNEAIYPLGSAYKIATVSVLP